jgi:hypothetical protein
MTRWEIEGRELVNCNCIYACPCQFNAYPDKGHCEAMGAFDVERGYFGDVRLDGTRMAMVVQWPGAVHEGRGRCQPVVDSRASDAQRDALLRILTGRDTEPFATVFAVFATTFEKVFDPIFTPIAFDADIQARRGHVRVDAVFELDAEPIRNPVTGKEHRVRIDLPHGFEYEIAEIGSGTGSARGNLVIDLSGTYAQFARVHLSNAGPVRHRAAA